MIAAVALDGLAEDTVILEMRNVASFCDYFVICEARSPLHIEAVRERIRKLGLEGAWTGTAATQTARFQTLPRARQEQMIANALGEAEVKAGYDAAVKKRPSLARNRDERVDYFARLFNREAQSQPGESVFRIESPPSESFAQNFLRSIRTREKPVLDGELGYMAQAAVNMAVESYRNNKVVFFDPVQGKMVDEPV